MTEKHLLRVVFLETLSNLFLLLSFHSQNKDWKQDYFVLITWFTVKLDTKSKKYIMLSDSNHLLLSIILYAKNDVDQDFTQTLQTSFFNC